jgi:hypothetical protein
MARARSIDKYPVAAFAAMFEMARRAADSNKTYRLMCETRKQAESRRFEFYAFIRALTKSSEIAHQQMAKDYRSFKLTLMKTGEGDTTYLEFQAWDRTALALDIMAQVQAFEKAEGLTTDEVHVVPSNEPLPPRNTMHKPGEIQPGEGGYTAHAAIQNFMAAGREASPPTQPPETTEPSNGGDAQTETLKKLGYLK